MTALHSCPNCTCRPPRSHAEIVGIVLDRVAGYHGVTVNMMLSQSRRKQHVAARRAAAFWLRQELGLAFKTIGYYLGGRDHATVMHWLSPKRRPSSMMGKAK